MRLSAVAATLTAFSTLCLIHAQQPPRKVGITPVGPLISIFSKQYFFTELYFLSDGGANALALVTDEGAALIDAKLPGWGSAVLEALRQVTDSPVTTIINTNPLEDHVGANAEYQGAVQIVMHENSSKRLARSAGPGRTFKTFSDHLPLTFGKRVVHLYHFGKGYTDGDVIVAIPDANVVFVGDLYKEKAVPIVDPANGGSALALPETLARATKTITGIEHVITSHGPGPKGRQRNWPTWNDFQEYAEFTREFVDVVTASWKNGRTAEQAAAELKLPDQYKNYRLDEAKATIEMIFTELKQSPAAKP